MKTKQYLAQFNKYKEYALTKTKQCRTLSELQGKLSRLSRIATDFYKENARLSQGDYQKKINIYLEFDEYLKSLKREFILKHPTPHQHLTFFVDLNDSSEMSSEEVDNFQQVSDRPISGRSYAASS